MSDDPDRVPALPAEIQAQMGPQDAPPPPPDTPDRFVCLRNCRHYWRLETTGELGNPQSFWDDYGHVMRRIHHICLLDQSDSTKFDDDAALECSRWDPMPEHELVQLRARREHYFKEHPEHKPTKETK